MYVCTCVCMVLFWFILFLLGEVIFNHKYPTEPPDIIWSADDEINNFNPEIDNLQVKSYSTNTLNVQCYMFLFASFCGPWYGVFHQK